VCRGEVEIAPLERDAWPLLKQLRIAALSDSPDAFGPTAEDAIARPDSYWRTWASRLDAQAGLALFVLHVAREPCGLVSATKDRAGVGHIGAMWVAPSVRGRHFGSHLLDRALDFLAQSGCRTIELSVTEGNDGPLALYRSRGFELTGASEPLRPGSSLKNLFMRAERDPTHTARR
jgi:ribosomal protein S18 acetylase RimI-like enzyme